MAPLAFHQLKEGFFSGGEAMAISSESPLHFLDGEHELLLDTGA